MISLKRQLSVVGVNRLLFLLLAFCVACNLEAASIGHDDPSPYIRLHVNDAVKWQSWDASVVQRAKKENKLILISSGYYSCHWCHVMRKESFNHASVAGILNNAFIPVKIDREIWPVLDDYLVNFMNQTQGYAGWPLNVFLTPDGYPVTGLVYLPRGKFIDVLKRLDKKWREDGAELSELAEQVFNYAQQQNSKHLKISDTDLEQALLLALQEQMDEFEGGIGEQSKFPMPYLLLGLLEIYETRQQQWLGEYLKHTLNQMVRYGLHDAVGGGFFRYTIDPGWQQPHFEKMLYTNAAMIRLYSRAAEIFGEPQWLDVAKETLDFILREMTLKEGGYASALTAQDDKDSEGGDYLWDEASLKQVLSNAQFNWFQQQAISIEGTLQFPHGLWQSGIAIGVKKRLLQRRHTRPVMQDSKRVLAWNAYLLSSMIELNRKVNRRDYSNAIESLMHVLQQDVKSAGAVPFNRLQDAVFYIDALWRWAELHNSEPYRQQVYTLAADILKRFYGAAGWQVADDQVIPMTGSVLNVPDKNLPASDAVFLSLISAFPEKARQDLLPVIQQSRVDSRVVLQPLRYASYIGTRSVLK